uniref:hypothetical protein n=1 Tax=Pseudomonas viridiflava TaxID=33069 RepID=UPI00197E99F6
MYNDERSVGTISVISSTPIMPTLRSALYPGLAATMDDCGMGIHLHRIQERTRSVLGGVTTLERGNDHYRIHPRGLMYN